MGKLKNIIIPQMNDDKIIASVMKEAKVWGLEHEVKTSAEFLMKEYPEMSKGEAYHRAALEWDI